MSRFSDQFTILPETGITELHCYKCGERWTVGYHPSLDLVNQQARTHTCKPAELTEEQALRAGYWPIPYEPNERARLMKLIEDETGEKPWENRQRGQALAKPVVFTRREPPDTLRYFTKALREGVDPEVIAIALELVADELEGP